MANRGILALACGLVAGLLGADVGAEPEAVRLRVSVVLDASQSMDDQDPGHLAEVAARLLVDLATAEEEVSIARFGTTARGLGTEVVRDDESRARLYEAIADVTRTEWCTDYRVGLEAALDALPEQRAEGERRLIIFLTDGLFDPDRSNEAYYRTDEGRAALERAQQAEHFAERPCARRFQSLQPFAEEGFLEQMDRLVERLSRSGVRLYTVGLGTALASESDEARRSRSLLQRLSSSTGGAFLAATRSDELPGFFASIYSALVGAPVEPPREAPAAADSLQFEVLRGARRVAVVVDAEADQELTVGVSGPGGSAPDRDLRRYHAPGEGGEGYRVLSFVSPDAGSYELRRTAGSARLRIQVIQEVGLTLALEGVPEAAPDGVAPRLTVGLRSSAGEPLQLSPEFLSHIRLSLSCRRGEEVLLDRSFVPGEGCSATVSLGPLQPGSYHFEGSASHDQGLLEVAPRVLDLRVIHQLDISFATARVSFDVMAEEEQDLSRDAHIALAEGSLLPIRQEFSVDWSGVTGLDHLEVGPERITLGPSERSAPVKIRFRDARSLRRVDGVYEGNVVVRPAQPELYAEESPRWSAVAVEGRLRRWTLGRYYQEYQVWVWAGFGIFVVLLSIVGRMTASKWSKKARLHYIELDDPTKTETSILLRRKSRSRLPFQSDRHPCGHGGVPGRRGKRRYCDMVARGNAGFTVVPRDGPVTHDKDGEPATARKPFRGSWEERYKLGDRYEVWLTRT